MSLNLNESVKAPIQLTSDQIVSDLSSIPINDNDVLFNEEINTALLETNKKQSLDDNEIFFEKLEKLVLFKSNLTLDNEHLNSELSLDGLNRNLESLDKHINSLQHFIDISKKFLSINK